jgi:hypothetical protein
MFSYVSPEQRVREDHPLRAIRVMTNRVFAELSPRFTQMYSDIGRPSIPLEQLLRALVLRSPRSLLLTAHLPIPDRHRMIRTRE